MRPRTRLSRTSPLPAPPAALHTLEARRLFASAALSGTRLVLTGNATSPNTIALDYSADNKSYVATLNGAKSTFAVAKVTSVKVVGGSASDTITFGTTVTLPGTLLPGNGSDTVYAGQGPDTITDYSGGNRFYTRGGNDTVTAGAGDDLIDSGDGNDSVLGNGGHDRFLGGPGDDFFDGGDGTDTADGGPGTDTALNTETRANIEKTTTAAGGGDATGGNTSGGGNTTAGSGNTPASASAVKPSPAITALDASITAGQSVFVNALATKLNVGTADTARFEWDFGDPSGAYNTLIGYNAGHVYAKAGTYAVTLRVWNQSSGYAAATMKVTVAAASRKAIYVSAAGSDANDGSSSAKPVKTVARAAALAAGKSDVDVLFRAGDAFGTSAPLTLSGENVRVGSYGSGNKPVIRWTGGRTHPDIINVNRGTVGAIVENVTIDSVYTGPDADRSGMPFAINVHGDQTTVRNVTFLNLGYDIQTNGEPTGLLVQGCDSPTKYGLRSYFVWGQGSDFVILGNTVANSTAEHPIRVYGVDRMLIADNDLSNPQAYSFETSKTALNIQKGSYVYVYDNTVRGPRMQVGPLGGADGLGDKSARLSHVVLENNTFLDTSLEIEHGVGDVYFRNNVFKFDGIDAFNVQGYDKTYARGVTNLNITNNTFINTGSRGRVLSVGGSVAGITLVNNLYQADSMYVGTYGTSAVYVAEDTLKSFTRISNNIWPVPTVSSWVSANVGGTPFAIVGGDLNDLSNYLSLSRWNALAQVGTDQQADVNVGSDWTPGSQALVTSGLQRVAGVFNDYDNDARPLGDEWTIGAVQL